MVFYLGVGLAALHPSMVSLSEPAPPSTRLTRTRLALLAGASLMAPAVLVIQALREEPVDVGVIAGGSVVLFLLTLARMGGLASEVAMQTERKRAMQTVLRATEQERVRLAADLHDGPVQELTALRYGLTRARNRIQRGQPDQAEGLLAELEDELAAGITGLRRLMAELRPAVLDERGLEVALHNQVRAFEATSGVACAISTGLQSRLAPRPGDGAVPGHPGDAEQRGQARRGLAGHGHAGGRERPGAAAHQRRRGRLRPDRGQPPAQREPLRPGRHARAGGDGRRPTSRSTRPPATAPPSTSRWPTTRSSRSAANNGSVSSAQNAGRTGSKLMQPRGQRPRVLEEGMGGEVVSVGQTRGFDEFYQACYGRLTSRPGTTDFDAEDVLQEAFARAAIRWRQLETYDAPEAWVLRVAMNLAANDPPPSPPGGGDAAAWAATDPAGTVGYPCDPSGPCCLGNAKRSCSTILSVVR